MKRFSVVSPIYKEKDRITKYLNEDNTTQE